MDYRLFVITMCLISGCTNAYEMTDTSHPPIVNGCSGAAINQPESDRLTRQEKIDLMEQALFDSASRYNNCMTEAQTIPNQADSSLSDLNDNGLNGKDSSGSQKNNKDETETRSLDGSQDGADTQTTAEGGEQSESLSAKDGGQNTENRGVKVTNGAGNQIIKPKDNDAFICKMLFEEMMKETDIKRKSGLKDQYTKYGCG